MGCSDKPGGKEGCCTHAIEESGILCADTAGEPPCRIPPEGTSMQPTGWFGSIVFYRGVGKRPQVGKVTAFFRTEYVSTEKRIDVRYNLFRFLL